MARQLTQRELEQMALEFEASIREVFLAAVQDIRDAASVQLIAELVQAGNAEGMMVVLGITAARYALLFEVVRQAFLRAGTSAASRMPPMRPSVTPGRPWRPARGYGLRLSFDITNPRAERWLKEKSSELVTHIIADQRDAIRVVLAEGMEMGKGPRQTALEIVGRMGTTGRRQGGIVGLTSQQADAVFRARRELSDPRRMGAYLRRKARDKRFDRTVQKAIRDGKPLTAEQIDRIAGRYADRLLKIRGDAIARTEAMQALNAGREQAIAQAIEQGVISEEQVTVRWKTAVDHRVRDTHRDMQNASVAWGEVFILPSGARMRYPGDTSLGAPAEEVIQCRCVAEYDIDFLAGVT